MATATKQRITVNRPNLLDAFSQTAKLARRGVSGALAATKLHTRQGMLIAEAANNEERMTIEVGDCDADFDGLIPSEAMKRALQAADPDDEVVIELDGPNCTVRAKGFRTRFGTPDGDSFPEGRTNHEGNTFTIAGPKFAEALRRAAGFCDQTEGKSYAINGVYIEIANGECLVAATDSRGIYIDTMPAEGDCKWNGIIPMSPTVIASSLIGSEVELIGSLNSVTFRSGGFTYTAQQLEGRFPRVKDCIPETRETLALPAGVLGSLVKRASLVLVSDTSRQLDFDAKDGTLRVKAVDATAGDADAETIVPSDLEFAFSLDSRYAAKIPGLVAADSSIGIHAPNDDSPVLFRLADGGRVVVAQIGRA